MNVIIGGLYLSNKVYIGIVISDLHNGCSIKPNILYHELKKGFLDYIEELKVIDFIIITGDFYDCKISMNSEHAKYSLKFMLRLLELSYKKNFKVRLLKGTESHDNKQLETLEIYTKNDKYDFRIIYEVESEMLFDDLKVLYLPEEYIQNVEDYYKDYFNSTYDLTFGHGLIRETMFIASKQESEITMNKAPIFDSKVLLNITKGLVMFGHIHNKQIIKERFFYIGSYSRWCFNEEDDKGFYLFTYNPRDGSYNTEFVINKLAKKYDTVIIDYKHSSFFNNNEKEQIEYLIKIVDNLLVDYIRLVINIPEECHNSLLLVNMINETFSKYSNVKTVINNNSKLRQKKETEEKLNLVLEKFGFIFNKNIPPEEKISKFIKIKYNKNITVEQIRHYLFSQIQRRSIFNGK